MAITITHTFVSGIADDAGAAARGEVLPSHWNAALSTSIATGKLIGRSTALDGPFEEIAPSGSLKISAGVLDLNDTGAVPGTYGSSSAVAVPTVDAQGRITGITTTPILFPATPTLQQVTTAGATSNVAITLSGANIQSGGSFRFNNNIKLLLGTTGYGSIYGDGTDLIINPQESGTGIVSIGLTSAGGGTKDLVANQLGLAGAPILSTAIINVNTASSTIRTALSFIMDYQGTASAFGPVSVTTTDNGTIATTLNYTNFTSSQQTQTNAHATLNQFGYTADLGIQNTIAITTAGTKTLVGFRVRLSQNGRANVGTNTGDFVRVGFLQGTVAAIGGAPTTSITLGAHFNSDVQLATSAKIILDGNTGDPTAAGLGDSTISYNTGSSRVELDVDATDAIYYTTTQISLLLDTALTDAKNIILGTTTGSKIGTATTQKLGFWNATPIVQPTTAIAAATFVANTSLIFDDSATWDGYTIGQVVKALRNEGLLA